MNSYELLKALRLELFGMEHPRHLMNPSSDDVLFASQDMLLNFISLRVSTFQDDFLLHIDMSRLIAGSVSWREWRAFDSLTADSYSRLVAACSAVGMLELSMQLLRARPAAVSAPLRL